MAEDEKLPEGLFKGDASKGVVWCVPITKNFVDSVVNTWMCCPNFSLCFNIFEAEEYHKIDKVAWYKALANDEDIEFWELINDDLDDNHAEYVVPYSAMINGMMKSFGIVNLMDDEDEYNTQLFVYPAETESYVIEEHQEIFLFAQRYFFEMFGSGAPVIKGEIPEPTDLMKHRWISQLLYRSFSLFYLPFIYSGVINTLLAKDKREMVEYMTGWKLYADIFRSTFTDLENEFSNWSYDKNLTVEGYDLVREKFKNFFLYDKKILQARAEGLGRNEPCPCGSGKKFKKCCGKGYC